MIETEYLININKDMMTQSLVIALIADIHNYPAKDIVVSLEKHKPDLITVCGDLIYGVEAEPGFLKMQESENAMDLLKNCVRIAPTYFSLGNHEWVLTEKDLDLIRDTGTIVLNNAWTEFRSGILIGGLSSAKASGKRKIPDCEWLDEFEDQPGYKILMSHHPEYWALQKPFLKDRKIDLVLSGHAHGGQIRFRKNGHWNGCYAHGQGLFPKYTSGIHEGVYGSMVVSRGLANTAQPLPRVFNETEMVYIILE